MITRYSLVVLCISILSSCTAEDIWIVPNTSDTRASVQIGTGTGNLEHQQPLVENLSGSGDVYYPIFHGLETKIIPIKHRTGVETKISFINSEATSMRVLITFPKTATGGNLRLAQIVMPDGQMDGPFWTDTIIELTQFGWYSLLFHENMMAGDPWSGNAIITVSLLKK